MVLEPSLVEGYGSSHPSAICPPLVYLKVHEGLCLVCLTLHMRDGPHMREGVKKPDIHIEPCIKSSQRIRNICFL